MSLTETDLRSYRPSREYMNPLRMNVKGLVGYSLTPPSVEPMLKKLSPSYAAVKNLSSLVSR